MKIKHVLMGAAALSLACAGAAYAADTAASTELQSIPWGKWVADALLNSDKLLELVVAWVVFKFVPPAYQWFLSKQTIEQAVHYAVATTANAVLHDEWSVKTTNDVLAQAEAYLIKNEPMLAAKAGALLRPMLISVLSKYGVIPKEADAKSLGVGG